MAKAHLIVVHGMGTHTKESVKSEVVKALTIALSWYSSMAGKKPEDLFEIIPYAYDKYFEANRQAAASNQELLDKVAPLFPVAELLQKIQETIIDDSFFATHWFDVILYKTALYQDVIQLDIAKVLVESIEAVGASNVHILAQSLGTAAVCDTLSRLYGPTPTSVELSVRSQKLAAVHMVSNVSRLLQTNIKVGASEVRPRVGCCFKFFEYRHRFDPFTKVKPFNPMNDGSWIPQQFWQDYSLIEPTSITDPNVHSLGHYLRDPLVHLPLLTALTREFSPLKAEREAAAEKHFATTIPGKAAAVRDAVDNLDYSKESIVRLLEAGKALKEVVEALGDTFA